MHFQTKISKQKQRHWPVTRKTLDFPRATESAQIRHTTVDRKQQQQQQQQQQQFRPQETTTQKKKKKKKLRALSERSVCFELVSTINSAWCSGCCTPRFFAACSTSLSASPVPPSQRVLTHSLTHSLTHGGYTKTHSLTHDDLLTKPHENYEALRRLTHSPTHSLFTHSLTHSLTHPLTHSLTHSLRRFKSRRAQRLQAPQLNFH